MYLTEKEKNIIVFFLKDKMNIKFIYLYGSYAKGEARKDSDIDLAIYTDDEINAYDLFIISNQLSQELRKEVQIVNLKHLDTVFAAQVVAYREELYSNDDFLAANYNLRTLRDYAKLNEERKVVLDAIKRDGRIYG